MEERKMKRVSSWPFSNVDQNNKEITRRKADDNAAPSSSAAPKGSNVYDVFLSFRGTDTRKTFVDHLYNGLVDAGIDMFRDDDELHEGEKIGNNLLQAIKNSKISILVLSRNYASSKWCLKELVQMTECMKNNGQVVLPIFYRVEPADVQHQEGSFGEAFFRSSGKYSEEEVVKWKQALHKVGSIKGWESEKTANGREGELVKRVVRAVLSKLKEAFQLVVTEQLVGIDDTVADILRLLDDNPNATQIVGIHGMGGIGKTTLAKVIYNKLSNQFQHHSFIANIRESSQRKGISCVQDQLMQDIQITKDEVLNSDVAIRIPKSRSKRKKVLILLDDVDNHHQLKALIGKHDWFERGSRIIITTRNKSILDLDELIYQYELNAMAEDQSLILFSRHAFRRNSPPGEFKSLSHDVVTTTGGLPLALEVIGSLLCGKNQAFWRDAIKRLMKVPHKEVQETLRISYEALEYWEQHIFLDIACFFIGSDLRIASYMWDACNFYPVMGIETLRFMSLIKIRDDHKLNMHDQLRDLGREIVRQEYPNAPINRSRLWAHEETLEVLQRNKGIEKLQVQALCFNKYLSNSEFATVQLETLPNLRFLQVCAANLIGDSKSLLWLHVDRCQEFVATSFRLEKLVILGLSWGNVSEHWEGWSHLKVAKELKVLKLSYSHCSKVSPDLSAFQNLEILVLERCFDLKQIHHSIGEVRGLVSLDLSGCWNLQVLPREMGKLEKLEELNISETAIEEIPPWIGSLKSLVSLDISGCKKLRVLPKEIGKLEELKELNIDNSAMEEIPPSIGSLKKLEILNAHGCKSLAGLPESIGSLIKLQRLSLGNAPLWGISIDPWGMKFPSSVLKLKSITPKVLPSQDIRELPKSIGDLTNLKILDITTSKLNNLPSTIGKLGNLEELHASHCWSLGGEIPINGLSSLKILVLSGTNISGFSDTFDKLSRLEKLDLCGCKMLQSLPKSMSKMPYLQHLQLIGCYELQSLLELPSCLTVLEVTCQHHALSQLSHLIHLKELTVYDCKLLEYMPELPSTLSKLVVCNCNKLKGLPSLPSLKVLSQLDILECPELTPIKGLEALKCLVHLDVAGSWKSSKFDGLKHVESLRYLNMSYSLVNDDLVQGLDRLKNLEELHIDGCEYLIRPDLSQLTHLKRLEAHNCHNIVEIKGLERLEILEFLIIQSCTSIETLPDLSCFNNLTYLDIFGCSKLRDVQGLEKVRDVQGLEKIRDVQGLKDVYGYSNSEEYKEMDKDCLGSMWAMLSACLLSHIA